MIKPFIKITLATTFFCLVTTISSSCSVAMAAKKSGADISKVQSARSRSQILATGAKIIASEKDAEGCLIETYQLQKEKGSAARAIMHGILDVSTLGLWEAVGTPIEGSMSKSEYVSFKVIYDKQENIKKIEL